MFLGYVRRYHSVDNKNKQLDINKEEAMSPLSMMRQSAISKCSR